MERRRAGIGYGAHHGARSHWRITRTAIDTTISGIFFLIVAWGNYEIVQKGDIFMAGAMDLILILFIAVLAFELWEHARPLKTWEKKKEKAHLSFEHKKDEAEYLFAMLKEARDSLRKERLHYADLFLEGTDTEGIDTSLANLSPLIEDVERWKETLKAFMEKEKIEGIDIENEEIDRCEIPHRTFSF